MVKICIEEFLWSTVPSWIRQGYNGGGLAEVKIQPWRICISMVADSNLFDEELDPAQHKKVGSGTTSKWVKSQDPHQSEKADQDPRQSEKTDRISIKVKRRNRISIKIKVRPDPHQSDRRIMIRTVMRIRNTGNSHPQGLKPKYRKAYHVPYSCKIMYRRKSPHSLTVKKYNILISVGYF